MGKLDGKVAIVTASAGAGIGQATVRKLAAEGASVAVADVHEGRITETTEDLKLKGARAIGIKCDVTDWDQVKNMVDETLKELGGIDILVNNAGINKLMPLWEMDTKTWDMVLNVNLKGTFYCCKAVLPAMIKQKSGSIVNISSTVVWLGSDAGEAHYTAAKAGVVGLTRSLALEVAKYKVRVNSIAPGFTPNPFLRKIYPEEVIRKTVESIPMGRGGEPDEIAKVALFLASDEASFITGTTLSVSGGWLLR